MILKFMKERILIFIILFFTIGLVAQSAGDEDLSLSLDTIISPICPGDSTGRIIIKDISIPGTIARYEWSDGSTNRNLDNVPGIDRKSTRLNSSHVAISYAVFCLKKKTQVNS